MPRVNVDVPDIPKPLAHYTPAVRTGGLVFAAGQIASDYKHGVAPEARVDPAFPYYGSEIKKQTRYVLENLAQDVQRRRGRPSTTWSRRRCSTPT